MKKKSPRGIPDFSSKAPSKVPRAHVEKGKPMRQQTPAQNINVKPQATSQKSGRRGG